MTARNFIFSLIVSMLVLGTNLSSAFAASGWIAGTLSFDSLQGNYCDTSLGMDCTGSRFPASIATGLQPVKEAEIQLLVAGEPDPIGTGYTTRTGTFSVFWERGAVPDKVIVRWVLRHKDNRYRVVDNNDVVYIGDLVDATPKDADTVDIGSYWWSFTEANNIYDTADRTWTDALAFSNRMIDLYTDVRIRWPASGVGNQAGTINGAEKIVLLGTNTSTRPQTTVSHEIGHVASYLSMPYSFCGAWNYPTACTGDPGKTCGGNHGLESSEHSCAAFEEGMAEFLGDVSYYWLDATDPRTCISDTPCNTGLQIEASLGSSCTADQSRQEIQVERYLWDAYDQIGDSGFTDNISWTYFTMIDTIAEWGTGTDNSTVVNDEPWNDARNQIDDADGRSARDFRALLENAGDPSTADLYTNNCTPPGD